MNKLEAAFRKRLISFQTIYDQVNSGDPWHGPSIQAILNRIDRRIIDTKSPVTGKSITTMLLHILAWRKFVLAKVKEEPIEISLNSNDDWPILFAKPNHIIKELHESFDNLQSALQKRNDEWLDTLVQNKEYTYEVMLYGLMNHDIHHFAQILIIDKEVRKRG